MLTEVDVDNPDFRFTPGMYATARLTLADKKNALAVPIQCVSTGDNPTVLVLNDDHRVEERAVSVGWKRRPWRRFSPASARATSSSWAAAVRFHSAKSPWPRKWTEANCDASHAACYLPLRRAYQGEFQDLRTSIPARWPMPSSAFTCSFATKASPRVASSVAIPPCRPCSAMP